MSTEQPRASETAERFVKQLNVAYKAVRLYPPSSAIPRESTTVTLLTLRSMLREDPDVRLVVTKEGLFHENGLVFPNQNAFDDFAREFFSRRLAEVRFHVGVTVDDLIGFLRVLDTPIIEFISSGGFESRLWDAGVVNITVKEASTKVVDHSGDAELAPAETPDFETATIDRILAEVSAGRPRDQIVLVRLIETPEALISYLKESARGRGTTPGAAWVTNRVSALASVAMGEAGESREQSLKALAAALMELDDDALREILSERLLPEAKHDESLAEVVRRMGVDRICEILAAGLDSTDESREGLTRAFRNLLHFIDAERDQGMGAIGKALSECGVEQATADQILADITPAQITVSDTTPAGERSPVERILRILDLAPGAGGTHAGGDADANELCAEAAMGITDGDVLSGLVSLVTIEQRDAEFASLMSFIEDGLSLLITRQEYHVAADVTDALLEASEDDLRPEHQRKRLRGALDILAAKPVTRAIAAAMRRHEVESEEYRACRHLLAVLGQHAIEPLLEVLADEPDMAARKAMVALISGMAGDHMDELGQHLDDSRWYFVRNIVSILGSTRTPDTLPLLGRTLRHPDVRVRRETIRAVSGIKDALATQMLVAAMEDGDEQIVQLSARYLGLLGARTSIGALEAVAQGQGLGNREAPARIEAIEALGRLASAGSLRVLRSLTRTRVIRGRARSREIASAAEAAIAVIERTMPAEGVDE